MITQTEIIERLIGPPDPRQPLRSSRLNAIETIRQLPDSLATQLAVQSDNRVLDTLCKHGVPGIHWLVRCRPVVAMAPITRSAAKRLANECAVALEQSLTRKRAQIISQLQAIGCSKIRVTLTDTGEMHANAVIHPAKILKDPSK